MQLRRRSVFEQGSGGLPLPPVHIKNIYLPSEECKKSQRPISSSKSRNLIWVAIKVLFALVVIVLTLAVSTRVYVKGTWRNSRIPAPPSLPERTHQERIAFVQNAVIENRQFLPLAPLNNDDKTDHYYDVFNCPLEPPPNYPRDYPVMDVLNHWPTDDTAQDGDLRYIHQGLCIFDFAQVDHTDVDAMHQFLQQIKTYRIQEVPFVIRNDPTVLETVERWNTHDYLFWLLQDKVYRGEVSPTKSMMYWYIRWGSKVPLNFRPPTRLKPFTFENWFKQANRTRLPDEEHVYLRLDGCQGKWNKLCDSSYRRRGLFGIWLFTQIDHADFWFDELPFFNSQKHPESDLYVINAEGQRGINCRFGMEGVVAENHFDSDRNFIAILGGERRYILGHPRNCPHMALYPQRHPLERHSQVDWSAPNLTEYPEFVKTRVNEVVLHAGDVMYLPMNWFHHIVSLSLNYQCNSRSGWTEQYDSYIESCGFNYWN